jgi:hypothetical protein
MDDFKRASNLTGGILAWATGAFSSLLYVVGVKSNNRFGEVVASHLSREKSGEGGAPVLIAPIKIFYYLMRGFRNFSGISPGQSPRSEGRGYYVEPLLIAPIKSFYYLNAWALGTF